MSEVFKKLVALIIVLITLPIIIVSLTLKLGATILIAFLKK